MSRLRSPADQTWSDATSMHRMRARVGAETGSITRKAMALHGHHRYPEPTAGYLASGVLRITCPDACQPR